MVPGPNTVMQVPVHNGGMTRFAIDALTAVRLARELESSLFAAPPWKERFANQAGRVHLRLIEVAEGAKTRGDIATDVEIGVLAAAVFSFYYMVLIGRAREQIAAPLPCSGHW